MKEICLAFVLLVLGGCITADQSPIEHDPAASILQKGQAFRLTDGRTLWGELNREESAQLVSALMDYQSMASTAPLILQVDLETGAVDEYLPEDIGQSDYVGSSDEPTLDEATCKAKQSTSVCGQVYVKKGPAWIPVGKTCACTCISADGSYDIETESGAQCQQACDGFCGAI